MPGNKKKSERPVIVFDLDDTICYPNHDEKDTDKKYGKAKKNLDVISRMRLLRKRGYYIVIHTARRMLTYEGDLDKIREDVWDMTVDWLERAKVPYDELVLGKPYTDTYYVDDKAMTPEMFKEWADDELRRR